MKYLIKQDEGGNEICSEFPGISSLQLLYVSGQVANGCVTVGTDELADKAT